MYTKIAMITLPSFDPIKRWLLHFIELQLFLTAISLPILINWGLPLSIGGLLGNLIFGPFLTGFLFISSLLFFTEMVGIPNQIIVYLLELIGNVWLWVLHFAHRSWLFGFPQAPFWFLCLVAIISVLIVTLLMHRSSLLRISLFTTLIIGSYCITHLLFSHKEKLFFIECHGKKVIGLYTDQQLVIIEPGACARLKSAQSWIDYTFMTELIKATGSTAIDHLIICQPGQQIFETITLLINKIPVKNLYLIIWDGTLTKKGWATYFNLCKKARDRQCTLTRIGKKEEIIHLPQSYISIAPLAHTITKNGYSFAPLQITLTNKQGNTLLYEPE